MLADDSLDLDKDLIENLRGLLTIRDNFVRLKKILEIKKNH